MALGDYMAKFSLRLLPLLVALAVVGCGTGTQPVEMETTVKGVVELNGKPVGPVAISFYSPRHGNMAKAEVDKSGSFALNEKIPAGHYTLYLSAPESGGGAAGIPSKYFSDTATDQFFELKPGENDIVMKLKR